MPIQCDLHITKHNYILKIENDFNYISFHIHVCARIYMYTLYSVLQCTRYIQHSLPVHVVRNGKKLLSIKNTLL